MIPHSSLCFLMISCWCLVRSMNDLSEDRKKTSFSLRISNLCVKCHCNGDTCLEEDGFLLSFEQISIICCIRWSYLAFQFNWQMVLNNQVIYVWQSRDKIRNIIVEPTKNGLELQAVENRIWAYNSWRQSWMKTSRTCNPAYNKKIIIIFTKS